MSELVFTTRGLIPLDQLEISDCVETGPNYRKIATEYRFNGELVRRDVAASALRMPDMGSVEGKLS